nr:hypothetical protein [Tanacetum cinerariifolium]
MHGDTSILLIKFMTIFVTVAAESPKKTVATAELPESAAAYTELLVCLIAEIRVGFGTEIRAATGAFGVDLRAGMGVVGTEMGGLMAFDLDEPMVKEPLYQRNENRVRNKAKLYLQLQIYICWKYTYNVA